MKNDKKVAAIIQARLNSTRFPEKVLHKLNGKPALSHVIDRVWKARKIDDIIIAFPDDEINLRLEDFFNKNYPGPINVGNMEMFLGDESNVIQRVIDAAKDIDIIVDITADCPLVDPDIIDTMIEILFKRNLDYVSNIGASFEDREWPDGLDVQVYRREILELAQKSIKDENHYSHVGWNIQHYKGDISGRLGRKLRIENIPMRYKEFRRPDWRLVLDTPEDAEVLSNIWKYFDNDVETHFMDILQYVYDNQDILTNKDVRTKIPGEG